MRRCQDSPKGASTRVPRRPLILMKRSRNDIATLATRFASMSNVAQVWCVFDNTASGAAIKNAWELSERSDRRAVDG